MGVAGATEETRRGDLFSLENLVISVCTGPRVPGMT